MAGEEEPYETIAVEKLTPIIGAEYLGVDLGKLVSEEARSNRQMDEIHRALAEKPRDLLPRSAHHSETASRLRPQVRRTAHSSRRTA
jgi:hypothetical protein